MTLTDVDYSNHTVAQIEARTYTNRAGVVAGCGHRHRTPRTSGACWSRTSQGIPSPAYNDQRPVVTIDGADYRMDEDDREEWER